MIRLLIASILFFTPLGGFADEKQREIENEAINLVIKKYGKGLENRLKGTKLNPNYRSWYDNDCFASVAGIIADGALMGLHVFAHTLILWQ